MEYILGMLHSFSPFHSSPFPHYADDCEVKQWDVQSGQVVWAIQLSSPGVSVRFHPDQPLQVSLSVM